MGAWGSGNLDNDTALEFVADYERAGASTVADSFAAVTEAGADYLDADVACAALAAAEVVAASFDRPLQGIDPDLAAELVTHRDEVRNLPGIVNQALTSVDAVTRASSPSELYELWQEVGSENEWLAAVKDLRDRLEESR